MKTFKEWEKDWWPSQNPYRSIPNPSEKDIPEILDNLINSMKPMLKDLGDKLLEGVQREAERQIFISFREYPELQNIMKPLMIKKIKEYLVKYLKF